jgi:site-specific recombinase XerC
MPAAWRPWWDSFARHLRAANRSPQTLEAYGHSLRQLALHLGDTRPGPREVSTEDLQGFMAELTRTRAPATAETRYKALRSFYGWLVAEGELERSPMDRVPRPHVPENPPEVLSLQAVDRLLKTCAGQDLQDRRDAALIRFMLDTGARLAGVAGLRVEDLDLDQQAAWVRKKGGGRYQVAFGRKTTRDLDRYLRVRTRHQQADAEALWLGERGPIGSGAIYQMLKRRAAAAGLSERVFPHLFRHTFGHLWRVAEGGTDDLMVLGGWKSLSMVMRYGASAAAERAREAHHRLSPGDRV